MTNIQSTMLNTAHVNNISYPDIHIPYEEKVKSKMVAFCRVVFVIFSLHKGDGSVRRIGPERKSFRVLGFYTITFRMLGRNALSDKSNRTRHRTPKVDLKSVPAHGHGGGGEKLNVMENLLSRNLVVRNGTKNSNMREVVIVRIPAGMP